MFTKAEKLAFRQVFEIFSRFCKPLDLNALHGLFGKSAVFGRLAPPGKFGAVEGGIAEAKKHFPVKIAMSKKYFLVKIELY